MAAESPIGRASGAVDFRSAFHGAPTGMSIVSVRPDSFGRLEDFNDALAGMLGYERDEFAALAVDDATHPDDIEPERALLDELLRGERDSYGIEKRLRRKGGDWIWALVTVSVLGDERPPHHVLGHVVEITERKAAEVELAEARENLERSNAELDQFAYVASHDLKEPLILLSAYARMLDERHGEALGEEGRTFLGHVREESARMKAMIDDLLDYSRLETRAGEPEPVDLAAAAEAARRTLAPRLRETGGAVELGDGLPTVVGTPSQFERLFRNLFSNAIKFHSAEPPRVEVTAERRDGEWLIAVIDNGIGIDPVKAGRVFDIFQRLHSQDRYAGTGMGLAICKRIVERHDGRIWVEPGDGGGSVFRFTLPA